MISLWPEWLRPLWLLALPLLLWLLWTLWHRQRKSGRWQQLLPPAFHSMLLKGGNGRSSRQPWIALGLAWLLGLLALLGPSWQHAQQSRQKPADPLVIVLDLTPSMLSSDSSPSRLEQARRKILDLLRSRPDAQTAIVVYAGSAHTVVPLSDDLATSSNLLESLKPSLMPQPGQRADVGVARALALLKQAQLGRGRILLITSALTEREQTAIAAALKAQPTPLLILGVGTAEGAPVVREDGSFLKDERGSILIPRLEASVLKRFAQQHGGSYATMRLNDSDLRSLGLLEGPQALADAAEPTQLEQRVDQGYWLLLPLLLLAALGGRRGWLLCLPLLLLSAPQASYAFSLDDLWLRPDQQGERLLKAQRPAEAAQRFDDLLWQGKALYEAGDYAGAAERFASADDGASHYNRGNALAKGGELEAALDAYEQALERQPELQPALQNKALIEQLLAQQKQQQQEQQPPESGDENQSEQSGPSEPNNSKEANGAPEDAQSNPANNSQSPEDSQREENAEQSESDAAKNAQEQTQPANEQAQEQDNGDTQEADKQTPHQERESAAPTEDDLGSASERKQATEQWLRQIPDDPSELLRRKFRYEQQLRQESQP